MGTPAARLEVIAGQAVGLSILVDDELMIGRHADGPGRLADDEEISRMHARVTLDPSGVCEIEDLGSTNGTYVNGLRISAPEVLSVGDTIEVGQTTLAVRELPTSRKPASSKLFFPEEAETEQDSGLATSAVPAPVPAAPPAGDGPAAGDDPEANLFDHEAPIREPSQEPPHEREPAAAVVPEPGSELEPQPEPEPAADAVPEPAPVAVPEPAPGAVPEPAAVAVPDATAPTLSLQLDVDFDNREARVSLGNGSEPVRFRFEAGAWRFLPPQPPDGPDAS